MAVGALGLLVVRVKGFAVEPSAGAVCGMVGQWISRHPPKLRNNTERQEEIQRKLDGLARIGAYMMRI